MASKETCIQSNSFISLQNTCSSIYYVICKLKRDRRCKQSQLIYNLCVTIKTFTLLFCLILFYYINKVVIVHFRRLTYPFCFYALLVDGLLWGGGGIATSLQCLLKIGRGIYDALTVLTLLTLPPHFLT